MKTQTVEVAPPPGTSVLPETKLSPWDFLPHRAPQCFQRPDCLRRTFSPTGHLSASRRQNSLRRTFSPTRHLSASRRQNCLRRTF